MPTLGGREALDEIRRRRSAIPVLFLAFAVTALAIGKDGSLWAGTRRGDPSRGASGRSSARPSLQR